MSQPTLEDLKNKMIEQLQKKLDGLQEQLDELKKGASPKPWPQEGDEYIYRVSNQGIGESTWRDDSIDRERFAIGNCFPRTEANRAMLEARTELAEHIHSFERRKPGEGYNRLFMYYKGDWQWGEEFINTDCNNFDLFDYEVGFLLPLTATDSDKAKRIELLQKAYP